MKQDISSLMDGELDSTSADRTIRSCCASDESKDTWNEYHLIGEVMRGHVPTLDGTRNARMTQALRDEPTVLAPRARRVLETALGRVALAAAASVATIGMVSWIGTQGGAPGVGGPVVAKSAPASAAIKPVSATVPSQPSLDVQDYLSAHRQIPSPEGYKSISNRGAPPAR